MIYKRHLCFDSTYLRPNVRNCRASFLFIALDRVDTSSFFCFNALSTVCNASCPFLFASDHFTATADVDGVKDGPGMHLYRSLIIGGDGTYVPFKSHSFLTYLGPKAYMLLLDCRQVFSLGPSKALSDVWHRAERRLDQVCGQLEYEKVFDRLDKLPVGVDHLVLQLGTRAWGFTLQHLYRI